MDARYDWTIWWNKCNELNLTKSHVVVNQSDITLTQYLPENSPLKQRLWHLIHQNITIPKCHICSTLVRWNTPMSTYSKYCSAICSSKDPLKVAKSTAWKNDEAKLQAATNKATQSRQTTNLDKYGHTNYLASNEGIADTKKSKISRSGLNYTEANKRHDKKCTLTEIANLIKVNPTTVSRACDRLEVEKLRFFQSSGEREISQFLTNVGVDIQHKTCYTTV